MTRTLVSRLFLLLCLILLLTTGCTSDDDNDTASAASTPQTLADLKALFDTGEITHIDFETVKQRTLLDEEIESMTIVSNNDIFDFELMEVITKSPALSENTPDALRQRNKTSLTFSEKAEPVITANNTPVGNWAQTMISISSNTLDNFTPRANLIDSEITTVSLVLLKDKLRMKFKKK